MGTSIIRSLKCFEFPVSLNLKLEVLPVSSHLRIINQLLDRDLGIRDMS